MLWGVQHQHLNISLNISLNIATSNLLLRIGKYVTSLGHEHHRRNNMDDVENLVKQGKRHDKEERAKEQVEEPLLVFSCHQLCDLPLFPVI